MTMAVASRWSSARGFANEFPIRVGVPGAGFPRRGALAVRLLVLLDDERTGRFGEAHQGIAARQDLEDFVESLVDERPQRPTMLLDDDGEPIGPDIISELCASRLDGDLLSTEEITSNIALIVGGGGETTRGASLNLWYLLLQHPDQLDAVRSRPHHCGMRRSTRCCATRGPSVGSLATTLGTWSRMA